MMKFPATGLSWNATAELVYAANTVRLKSSGSVSGSADGKSVTTEKADSGIDPAPRSDSYSSATPVTFNPSGVTSANVVTLMGYGDISPTSAASAAGTVVPASKSAAAAAAVALFFHFICPPARCGSFHSVGWMQRGIASTRPRRDCGRSALSQLP